MSHPILIMKTVNFINNNNMIDHDFINWILRKELWEKFIKEKSLKDVVTLPFKRLITVRNCYLGCNN